MINNLKNFKRILKEINFLIKEKEINDIILQDFKTTMDDINNQIDMSNNNIEILIKEKDNLNKLSKEKRKYKIKGWIYTFLPILIAVILSPIIFITLNFIQAGVILCLLSATLSAIGASIGFEEYDNIKKELEKLPKINNELQIEYKNNNNLKYDLSFYIYKDIEIRKDQKNILNNIQNLLKECEIKKEEKQTFFNNNIYSKLISNKKKIKK